MSSSPPGGVLQVHEEDSGVRVVEVRIAEVDALRDLAELAVRGEQACVNFFLPRFCPTSPGACPRTTDAVLSVCGRMPETSEIYFYSDPRRVFSLPYQNSQLLRIRILVTRMMEFMS
jgi:hypothetical protein